MKIRIIGLLLLTTVTILSGCNRLDDSRQMAGTLTNTPRPDPVTATATPLPPKEYIASPESIIPSPTQESRVPEGEDTFQTQSTLDRCGLLLPLTSAPTEPVNTSYDIEIPADMLPIEALPALERLISAPETVALVAYEVGRESQGVYHNPDVPMPLASVVKIINLVAFAEAAAEGIMNPADWISLDNLNRSYLPGSDLGAHNRALSELEERGLIGRDPPSIPLEEVPWMMIRHSSNAASDYNHLTLGPEKIESTAISRTRISGSPITSPSLLLKEADSRAESRMK
jgi:hypothetical protein